MTIGGNKFLNDLQVMRLIFQKGDKNEPRII